MGFQVSPGVAVSEIDLTTIVPAISTTDGAFVGVFKWGPLKDIKTITNELDLVKNFGKPDVDTASSFFTAANFLAYSNKLRLVRVADTSTASVAYTVSTTGTAMTGTGFTSGTPALRVGSTITSGANTRTVVAVGGNTSATLSSAFPSDLSSASVTAAIYTGSLNACGEFITGSGTAGVGVLISNDDEYETNFSGGAGDVGLWAAKFPGELGNSLEVSLCPSSAAFIQTLAGTVSTSGTSVTGSGTAFDEKLIVGSYLINVATGEARKVTNIGGATSATIESAFSANLSSATCKAKWQYADNIGIAPGTSDFVSGQLGLNDEMHVIVIDKLGKFSGAPGTVLERFMFVSKASDARKEDGTSNYYKDVINKTSEYIRWMDHLTAGLNWGSAAAGTTFTSVTKPNTIKLSGGRDVNTGSSIDAAKIIGYDLFANPDVVDVALLMCGEASTAVVVHAIGNIAETRKDCVALISPERSDVVDNAGNEVEDIVAFRNTLPSSSYAFMDSGWKYQYDKYNDTFRYVPLNGDIAGLCARTDDTTAPWFSPAGYNRGNIKNVIKLAYNPSTRADRDDLYLAGVNSVLSSSGNGTVLFGDKTLLSKPSAFDRINVRRLFIVLEKSIAIAAKFSLFEINNDLTRAQFRNLVEPFLRTVQGKQGIYDYKVVCDSTNNTPNVIDRNEFVGDIYIKPARSINYIQLNFIATPTAVEFSEIVGKI